MFTAPDHPPRRHPQSRGLTLLEVVVGLAILGLMAGAIYAIVAGSIESTVTLQNLQTEDRRVETFLNQTRLALTSLPAGATIELRLLENEPLRQEFILRGLPTAFIWGQRSRWEQATVTLAPQPWPEERLAKMARPSSRLDPRGQNDIPARRFSLAFTVPDFFRTDADGEPLPDSPVQSRQGHQLLRPDIEGRFWLELLPEIERIQWRFYDPRRKQWLEKMPPGRPPMIELQLTLPGRKTPLRAVFGTA